MNFINTFSPLSRTCSQLYLFSSRFIVVTFRTIVYGITDRIKTLCFMSLKISLLTTLMLSNNFAFFIDI